MVEKMESQPSLDHVELQNPKKVNCVGIHSGVKKFSDIEGESITLGHVLMRDFENTDLEDVKRQVKSYEGFGFIFRSHQNNYHSITPVVKSVVDITNMKEWSDLDDDDHTELGFKKGRWTLRISRKGDKPEPEFVEYVCGADVNPKMTVLSSPHLDYLADFVGSETAATLREECETVGETFETVQYETRQNNHELNGD